MVVGLVAEVRSEGPRVLGVAIEEHQGRAMMDGQIHDIEKVAAVVAKVKRKLEEQLGFPLQKVAVAAAGRTLITVRQKVEHPVSRWSEIKEEQVRSLELEAIRKAQQSLNQNKKNEEKYYCVGYTIVAYQLDLATIGNPVGQRGEILSLELIATFLPQVVVDSLIAVLDLVGLEMDVMTLEPIAALEFAIPPTMRRLNLALVDIGAGTSDIAITSGGSVVAFAMAPMAGDEITEKLCDSYLLDFMDGELLKRRLRSREFLFFKDILGMKHKIAGTEVIATLRETIQGIAGQIGETILQLNEGPPQAVICIGGGSLTPSITEELAQVLGLPKERVAVRSAGGIGSIQGLQKILAGPEGITPLGIALMASRPQVLGLSQVQVNNRNVRLFRGAKATVADALMAAGMGFTELHGKPGRNLSVEVNGELHLFKGSVGEPAEIFLNGIPVVLDTVLPPEAVLKVGQPRDGLDAAVRARDILPDTLPAVNIIYDGQMKILEPLISMNGQAIIPDTLLHDRASVSWRAAATVSDALQALGFSEEQLLPRILRITVNGEQEEISLRSYKIYKNRCPAGLGEQICNGDELVCEPVDPILRIKDLLKQNITGLNNQEITVYVNGEAVALKGYGIRFLKNGVEVEQDEIVGDGDKIAITRNPGYTPILADIFNSISFNRNPPCLAARLVMLLNEQDAQFTTPVKHGDQIRIFWEDTHVISGDTIKE